MKFALQQTHLVVCQRQMDRKYQYFVVLLCLQSQLWTDLARGDTNLHVRPPVRTVDTGGYQLTSNAYVGEWLLRIMNGNRFACGAAYYSKLYVLTSASCMHKYKSRLNELSVELLYGKQFALIESISVPRQYQWPSNFMDIAVVKLIDPIPGNGYTFVKLCSRSVQEYSKLTVVACGTGHGLITQQVNLLNQMDCEQRYTKLRLAETIACTHAFNQANECVYDFGCPVTAGDDELCGIVAYGPECRNANLPGLFTDIYQVKHFIRKVVYGPTHKATKEPKQTWFDE